MKEIFQLITLLYIVQVVHITTHISSSFVISKKRWFVPILGYIIFLEDTDKVN